VSDPRLPGRRTLVEHERSREFDAALEPRKEWRVTVRMTPMQYERLGEAARLYGVRPTTLARMLIKRGATAILDEERRDRYLHGDDGT
jgi:hypothetical protein